MVCKCDSGASSNLGLGEETNSRKVAGRAFVPVKPAGTDEFVKWDLYSEAPRIAMAS